jgi:DNA helicase-2/ATP-dependent DNA helicase PcrA
LSSHWLEGLNPEQGEAVLHNNGPLLILAGAGSGKTTVLVSRAGRLIDENVVEASELCVLTFTNKAAKELKFRVTKKLGSAAKKLWSGTFHSFGLGIIRKNPKAFGLPKEFGILDPTDTHSLVKELLKDFNQNGKTAYDAEKLLFLLSHWRERGQKEALKEDEYESAVEWLLPRYENKLSVLGMVDFDGLLLKPLELALSGGEFWDGICSQYRQVMVDEFQDTNELQMRFLNALVKGHKNLAVVGDDDQSIYGWRGANVSNILDFPKFYSSCKVVRLEKNYRSVPAILDVANQLIAKNVKRHVKVLHSALHQERGDKPKLQVFETEHEEAEGILSEVSHLIKEGEGHRSIAILYRSNSQGALLEAEFRKNQIPYLISGGTGFFDRKETRDILAYLRCALFPNEVALRRIINVPPRGIGDKTIERISALSEQNKISFFEALKNWKLSTEVEEKTGTLIEAFLRTLTQVVPFLLSEEPGTVGEKMLRFFDQLGYRTHLEKIAPNTLVGVKRWRMLEVFSGILDRYIEVGGKKLSSLKEFLDSMELRDVTEEKKESEERVQLMTLHSCKGLEFTNVFLVGIEEDIIPHKTLGSDISEERRLFYVGITRAKNRLWLTRALKRRRHGKWVDSAPSRFLLEIPSELLTECSGFREINSESRKSMVSELFKKLDALDKVEKVEKIGEIDGQKPSALQELEAEPHA